MTFSDRLFLICVVLILMISTYFHQLPETSLVSNPVYAKFEQFAATHELDLSGFESLQPGWKFQPKELGIFELPMHSADVLLVGDSSVNYGIEPVVVEQASGLTVAVFAYPALRVNADLLEYVDDLAAQVLKPGGLVLFMFDPGFWSNRKQTQQNQQLNELIAQRFQSSCLFCMKTLREHEAQRQETAWMKFINRWLGLASVDFYATLIEPTLAPRQAHKKFRNNQGITKNEQRFWLSDGHVLVVKETPNMAQKNEAEFVPRKPNKRHLDLVPLMAELNHPKVMVIPITQTAEIHQKLQQVAYVLAAEMKVIDMNKVVPDHWAVPLQNRTHMANEGIILQSWLLGKQLSDLVNAQRG